MTQDVSEVSATAHGPAEALNSVLACPRCGASLSALRCATCERQYPQLGDVPWLFADPEAQLSEWRNRWHLALRNLQQQEQAATAALERSRSNLTKTRLGRLADAYAAQRQAVQTLLAPLDVGVAATRETYLALQTTLPEQHRLFSYAANLFRDWCWGDVENHGAWQAIEGALTAASLRPTAECRVLILGSGGGRLAHDLHARWQPQLTVGLEINPYLALAGAQICADEPLTLYEFPLAPRSASDVACRRQLQRPAVPLPAGLEFVSADAFTPPFAAEQFDVVITPWFSDICGASIPDLAALVNNLLAPAGSWINHGSVAFHNSDPAACSSLEEFIEQASAQGFSLSSNVDCTLPYLQSPSSRHSRVEQINTSCLNKQSSVSPPKGHALEGPRWLMNLTDPVPQSAAFRSQAQSTAVHAFIMSMIDGNRSIVAMAEIMAARGLLSDADARQALRGFLEKMHKEATGQAGL
ncbi:MAG: hypothetical protein ACR2PZ_13400 [Pseudomonadales bacterium]